MKNKKTKRNGGDTPLPETKPSDFHPADYNKDGRVSNKERRQYDRSESNKRKAGQPKKKVNVAKGIASLSSAAITASEAIKKVKKNLKD